jgi:cytochrome P450/glutathione S-transferase
METKNFPEMPRHVIVSARVSPMVELARWLFERDHLTYHEEPHAPILHVLATRRRGGGREVPVIVGPEGIWDGARAVLDGLDAKSRPGQRLYGESDDDRAANRALIDTLLALLLQTVRRLVYFHLLPHRRTLYPVAVDGVPLWERAFVFLLYPIWRRLMARGLDLSPQLVQEAPARIREACDLIEATLGRRPFLGGQQPNTVDIVFSALMAPVVFPPHYDAKLPALAALPAELSAFVEEMRARRAGALVLDTYEHARGEPQQPLPARGSGRPLQSYLLGPATQRLAAKAAAAYGKILKFRNYRIAVRWDQVEDVLRRDLDFRIAAVNGPRIEEVNGPFILGLDRGAVLTHERPQLYTAVSAIDLGDIRTLVEVEAKRLLDEAVARGRLDLVNGYARLVAARTARRIFGIAGPTEMDLMRVIRAIFQHTFLNLGGDEQVARRAVAAFQELRQWFQSELARRAQQGIEIDDVIGRLLALRRTHADPLDDDGVRRNVAGLLVGSIDTTATSVSQIVASACADPEILARVERDVDDPARMLGWCNELLRRWPHNPFLLRQVETDVTLDGVAIPAGATVIAYTHAAMFDPSRFPDPRRLDPTRALKLYRHFGGGLHPCSGRAVNDVQIPELVRQVIKRGIASADRPRFDGPFIDEVVVTFGGRTA